MISLQAPSLRLATGFERVHPQFTFGKKYTTGISLPQSSQKQHTKRKIIVAICIRGVTNKIFLFNVLLNYFIKQLYKHLRVSKTQCKRTYVPIIFIQLLMIYLFTQYNTDNAVL